MREQDQSQGKGALYTNDSVSVYYDASEKIRRPLSSKRSPPSCCQYYQSTDKVSISITLMTTISTESNLIQTYRLVSCGDGESACAAGRAFDGEAAEARCSLAEAAAKGGAGGATGAAGAQAQASVNSQGGSTQ